MAMEYMSFAPNQASSVLDCSVEKRSTQQMYPSEHLHETALETALEYADDRH